MDDFKYKTYRCEWVAEVYEVDQYNQRQKNSTIFYQSIHPTQQLADQALDDVTEPCKYVEGRRLYPSAPHSYYSCSVSYRQILVKESYENPL